jgi:hypothetical protein
LYCRVRGWLCGEQIGGRTDRSERSQRGDERKLEELRKDKSENEKERIEVDHENRSKLDEDYKTK